MEAPILRVSPLELRIEGGISANKKNEGLAEAEQVVSSERDEQFILFPQQSAALQNEEAFFQRRYSQEGRFKFFSVSEGESNSGELLKTIPQIADAMAYCPLTNEIVFQAPPIGSNGKFNLAARPSRVYIFSLKTGVTQLIWRRKRDLDGTFVPRLSATPDCQHVLVNQKLEKQGNKIPYGQIVHLKKPHTARTEEWSFSVINETNANGVWRGFSDAVFILPRDPKLYVPAEAPPAVFAITEMVLKDRDNPLLNLFTPSLSEKRKGKKVSAEVVSWERKRTDAGEKFRSFSWPTFDNSMSSVFLVGELREKNENDTNANSFVGVPLSSEELSAKDIVIGKGVSFFSGDINPEGNRIALGYLQNKKETEIQNLEDRKIAGVAEVEIVPAGDKLQWSSVAEFLPFHALEPQHHPRPTYNASGTKLYFVVPEIAELPGNGLYLPGAKLDGSLQYGSKLYFLNTPRGK